MRKLFEREIKGKLKTEDGISRRKNKEGQEASEGC
jgi:hypothetical protein